MASRSDIVIRKAGPEDAGALRAILRDTFSKTQYRVRAGHQLGRLRVSGIRQKAVQFTIEEFGFNRQEILPLTSDNTNARNP